MRCYSVYINLTNNVENKVDISEGVYLVGEDNYLELGERARARLSDALAERLRGMVDIAVSNVQLLRCNVEQRAELWLTPETQATRDQKLIKLRWYNLKNARDIEIGTAGDGSTILYQHIDGRAVRRAPYIDIRVLAKLPKDGELKISFTQPKRGSIWSRTTRYVSLPGFGTSARAQPTRYIRHKQLIIGPGQDGTLTWSITEGLRRESVVLPL